MSFQIEPVGYEAAPEVIELIHRVFDEYGFIWDPEDEFWGPVGRGAGVSLPLADRRDLGHARRGRRGRRLDRGGAG